MLTQAMPRPRPILQLTTPCTDSITFRPYPLRFHWEVVWVSPDLPVARAIR
jgi:hypothetical protein